MAEDAATDRPFIAAIAISKARGGLPAPGFFDCARRLGRFAGDEEGPEAWAFHAGEFNAAVSFWAATATTGKRVKTQDLHSTQAPASTQLRIVSRGSAGGIR